MLNNQCTRRLGMALATSTLLVASPAQASDFVVPGDFPTIQSALDAAVTGDSIRVLPGTYVESLQFRGEDVHLFSDQGAAVTVLEAPPSARTITLQSGEGPGAIVEGFTIRGSAAVDNSGGIEVTDASPILRGNQFTQLTRHSGGAVSLEGGAAQIEGNEFFANTGTAVVALDATVCLEGNVFRDNDGDEVIAFQMDGGRGVLRGNEFIDNRSAEPTSRLALIDLVDVVELHDNRIVNNDGRLTIRGTGRAEFIGNEVRGNTGSLDVRDVGRLNVVGNAFVNNRHQVRCSSVAMRIENNLFAFNVGTRTGGLHLELNAPLAGTQIIRGNTLYFNEGERTSAFYCEGLTGAPSSVECSGNIFSGSSDAPSVMTYALLPGTIQYADNCFWADGGPPWGGPDSNPIGSEGNIEGEPGLVDPQAGDFGLRPGSICLDAAGGHWMDEHLDLAGNPRLSDGDLDGALLHDMGAFERTNVSLTADGDLIPGGLVNLHAEGRTGEVGLVLFAPIAPAPAFTSMGTVFLQRGGAFQVVAVGSLPLSATHLLPDPLPGPVGYQAAMRVSEIAGGNTSNPVFVP